MPSLRERVARWVAGKQIPAAPPPLSASTSDPRAFEQIFAPGYMSSPFRAAEPISAQDLLQAYRQNPWAHVKLFRLASAVAGLGWDVGTESAGGEFNSLPDSYPLRRLLMRPNLMMRGYDFLFLTTLYAKIVGEVYWRKLRGAFGRPEAVYVLPPQWVRVVRDRTTARPLAYRVRWSWGAEVDVPPEDMIWLRQPDPLDPYASGLGDLLAAATEIQTFEYASESNKRLHLNDSVPASYMTMPGQVPTDDDAKVLRDDWQRKYGGFWNTGNMPLLFGGAEIKSVRASPKEMQFIEGQRFLRDVITAGFPPEILGIVENSNRATIDAADLFMARYETVPTVGWLEDHINDGLAADFDGRARLRFDDPVPEDREFTRAMINDAVTRGQIMRGEYRRTLERLGIELEELPEARDRVFVVPGIVQEIPAFEEPEEEEPEEEEPEEERAGRGKAPSDGIQAGRRVSPPGTTSEAPPTRKQRWGDPLLATSAATREEYERKQPPGIDPAEILEILGEEDAEGRLFFARLRAAYVAAMEGRWERAAAEVGLAVDFDLADPEVERWLREEAGRRIRGIVAETLSRVRLALAVGVSEGESIVSLARRLTALFDGFKEKRALTIARTETLTASNRAAYLAYGRAGVERVEWLTARDELVEANCVVLDGKIVELGQEFAPGVLFPPLHPRCRCAVSAVVGESRAVPYEDRAAHITALGRAHAHYERIMLNAVKRGFQEQQGRLLRRLRAAGKRAA